MAALLVAAGEDGPFIPPAKSGSEDCGSGAQSTDSMPVPIHCAEHSSAGH
jgi:hypothetical protein